MFDAPPPVPSLPARISRRTLTRGVAWSVPVVVSMTAVPAFAASGQNVKIADTSAACKITQGVKVYEFLLDFANTATTSTTVCFVSGTMYPNGCDPVQADPSTANPKGGCVTVPAGKSVRIVVDSAPSTCEANGYLTATYTYTSSTGESVSVTTDVPFNSVKPCKDK